jgi:hypothetical protein
MASKASIAAEAVCEPSPAVAPPFIEPGGWRLLLVTPLLVGLTLLAHARGWHALLHKPNLEVVAPPILAVAVLGWLRAWWIARETAIVWLGVLAAVFLCREIHFAGSDGLLEVSLAVLAVWAVLAWRPLLASFRRLPARAWIVAAFFTYFVSQVIARRVFQGIPGEQGVHVPLEELLEDGAHLLFLVAALAAARWAARRGAAESVAR